MSDRPQFPAFLCPQCGSNEYHSVRLPVSGGWTQMPWFSCGGCSVMFQSPDRFQRLVRRTYTAADGHKPARTEEQATKVL